uniref:Membrane protein insertion efficiency factor n=1 Tax=Lactuca sativa TaxID=4236 RepID=A0A9R1UJZ9_LACSA|nr:hypothetical protein LSAT_V11C900467420 [Lactuca sativa]
MALVWSPNVLPSSTPTVNPNYTVRHKFPIHHIARRSPPWFSIRSPSVPCLPISPPLQFSVFIFSSCGNLRSRSCCLHVPIVNELGKESDESSKQGDNSEDLGVKVALSMLRFYKREISPLMPKSCRYVPTCSEYSMIAYKKYGVAKGSILTAWRLCRCNPLGGSGFDPPRWFDEPSPPEQ